MKNNEQLFVFNESDLLKKELLSALVAQINKDLNICILEANLTQSTPFLALKMAIEPHVIEICANPDLLKKVINHVDLSEPTINKFLKVTAVEYRAERLTELFIKRCLQKVVIRNYYRKGDAGSFLDA